MRKFNVTKALAATRSKSVLISPTTSKLNAAQREKLKEEQLKEASNLKATYCRKCNQMKPYRMFWTSSNQYLDTNGKMSICIDCADKMFTDIYEIYLTYERTFFLMCQHLDIKYDESVVSSVRARMPNVNEKLDGCSPFALYLKLLYNRNKNNSVRYCDTLIENNFNDSLKPKADTFEKELLLKWGERSQEDYAFLEKKYNEYVSEFGANSISEKDNFIQLASLLLRSRQDPTNKDVATALKEQYKSCGISPDQMRKENKEKGAMTLGITIAQMELCDPADFYDRPEMYADNDKFESDKKEILRAQKNHLTGSQDFESTGFDCSEIEISAEDEDE